MNVAKCKHCDETIFLLSTSFNSLSSSERVPSTNGKHIDTSDNHVQQQRDTNDTLSIIRSNKRNKKWEHRANVSPVEGENSSPLILELKQIHNATKLCATDMVPIH